MGFTGNQEQQKKFGLLPKIINGGIAGIVGVSCIFPVDLVKTRLQNQQDHKRIYNGFMDCLRKTVKHEGIRGLYSGITVNLVLITPEKAIKLVANDYFRHIYKNKNGQLPILREVAAGGSAGALQIVVTTPMELLKIQLQDAGRVGVAESDIHVKEPAKPGSPGVRASAAATAIKAPPKKLRASTIALELIKQKGIFGLYKGLAPTFLRDVAFSMVYFPLFAHLNALGKQYSGQTENVFYISFIAGLAASSFGAYVVTPFDVVKTRLQVLRQAAGERQFTGVANCFAETLRHEGVRALFKGAVARVLVIGPLFAIAQMVYFLGIGERLLGVHAAHAPTASSFSTAATAIAAHERKQ